MAWESRNGQGAYYTRSRRCGERVTREYIGSDETAMLIAKLDALERQERKAEQDAQHDERAQFDAIDAQMEQLGELADELARAVLTVAGYHQHKGGEWRKYRERKPVDSDTQSPQPGFNHLGNGPAAGAI